MRILSGLIYLLLFTFPGFSQHNDARIDQYLTSRGKGGSFNGTILIARNDQVLFHKAYGLKNAVTGTINDTNSLYRIGSVTKPVTATLILRLVHENKLSLKDSLSAFIPDFPNGNRITISHLLTHSSGVQEYLQVKEIRYAPDSSPPIALEKLISYFKNGPVTNAPGEKFNYSNSNYILLAFIIEKVIGQKFEHAVREYIFKPAGMINSGFDFKNLQDKRKTTGHQNVNKKTTVTNFDSTYAPGCGAMYSDAKDLYHFYKSLLKGVYFSDSLRAEAFQPRYWKYGYGWFSYSSYDLLCISHAGGVPGFYAEIKFFPEADLCIILLTNSSTGHIDIDKIAAILLNKKFKSSGI